MERKSCSIEQFQVLVQFLEGHMDLALGRYKSKEGRVICNRLWTELSFKLNSINTPLSSVRSAKEWVKYYTDYKARLNKKIRVIKASLVHPGDGQGDNIVLSPLEARLAGVLGYQPEKPSSLDQTRHMPFETNDNDAQDGSQCNITGNTTDFYEVKIPENESESETDSILYENPLYCNTSDTLTSKDCIKEEPSTPISSSTVQILQPSEVNKQRKSKNTRQLCRKFKRRETVNEFDIFAKHIALQLKLLPPEGAVQAQAAIQSVLTRFRLESIRTGKSCNNGHEKRNIEFIDTYYYDADSDNEMDGSPKSNEED